MKKKELYEMLKSEPIFALNRYQLKFDAGGLVIMSKDGFFGSMLFQLLVDYRLEFCLDCDYRHLLIYCAS